MAVFQAFNAAGVGFNMSSTNSSGWAFIGANPSVTTDLVHDDGSVAEYEVDGSALVDYFTARYWSDDYTVIIDDLLYENNGEDILSIEGLNLYTTVDELEGYAWYVTLMYGPTVRRKGIRDGEVGLALMYPALAEQNSWPSWISAHIGSH